MEGIKLVLQSKTTLNGSQVNALASRLWEIANKVERTEEERNLAANFALLVAK